MDEKQKNTKECPRNSILDFNFSWVLLIVYLAFLFGIWFAQNQTAQFVPGDYVGGPYFFISIFCGLVFSFLLYNGGKILFAKLSGYRILSLHLLGFMFDAPKDKFKFHYDILSFFELQLRFVPKDDDLEKNPRKIFLGGFILEGILIIAVLLSFFLLKPTEGRTVGSGIAWTLLFGSCYGFLTPLYEILPFRQDYPTDMFNLLVTKSKDDQIAYNLLQVNRRRELSGEDFLHREFESYESFYGARALYFLYLDHLYASRLEKAFNTLESMKYYNKYFDDSDRYQYEEESIYLRFFIDDDSAADQIYLSLKKDDKKEVTSPRDVADYRSAVLIAGYIAVDAEKVKNIASEFDQKMSKFQEDSRRLQKEKDLFKAAYNKVVKNKPEFNLTNR